MVRQAALRLDGTGGPSTLWSVHALRWKSRERFRVFLVWSGRYNPNTFSKILQGRFGNSHSASAADEKGLLFYKFLVCSEGYNFIITVMGKVEMNHFTKNSSTKYYYFFHIRWFFSEFLWFCFFNEYTLLYIHKINFLFCKEEDIFKKYIINIIACETYT